MLAPRPSGSSTVPRRRRRARTASTKPVDVGDAVLEQVADARRRPSLEAASQRVALAPGTARARSTPTLGQLARGSWPRRAAPRRCGSGGIRIVHHGHVRACSARTRSQQLLGRRRHSARPPPTRRILQQPRDRSPPQQHASPRRSRSARRSPPRNSAYRRPRGLRTSSVPPIAPRPGPPARPGRRPPAPGSAPPRPFCHGPRRRAPPPHAPGADGGLRGLGVAGDVRERLGDHEVGRDLDRRVQPLLGRLLDRDRYARALGERDERRTEAALAQHRRVQAAGELAQLPRSPSTGRRSPRRAARRRRWGPRRPCAARAAASSRARRGAAGRRREGRARAGAARRRRRRRSAPARRAAPTRPCGAR